MKSTNENSYDFKVYKIECILKNKNKIKKNRFIDAIIVIFVPNIFN